MSENSVKSNGGWKLAGVLIGSFISVITLLSIFITAGLRADIHTLDNKMLVHLTNHEIHCPRTDMISKAEFDTYKFFVNENTNEIKNKLDKIENIIVNNIANNR